MLKLEDNQFFSFEAIGEFRANDLWVHPRRIINHYELILVLDGEFNICEDEVQYIMEKNEMLILEPGLEHYGLFPVQNPACFYWFHFTTNLPIHGKIFPAEQSREIKQMLRKLLYAASTGMYSEKYVDVLGYLILDELKQLLHSGLCDKSDLSIKINEYIHRHYMENIAISDVANHFGYNQDYVGKLYKKEFGLSIKMQLANLKISYAENLLLTTNKTIKQIAAELNYDEENTFIKFFIYHKKMSPSQYRRKIIRQV